MKLAFNILLIVVLAAFALALSPQKPVIVSYPKETPNSVLDQAKEAIIKAGGIITHEYTLIKGFAARASEKALDTVQVLGTQSNVVIEDDQIVSTNDE